MNWLEAQRQFTLFLWQLEGRVAQSVQRLATAWTVRGSNPGGGEIFRTCQDRPWGPPSLLYNGYRLFPGGKERPGRDTDPSPPSSAVVVKGQSYTCTPHMGRTACTEPHCLYKGDLYLFTFFLPFDTCMVHFVCCFKGRIQRKCSLMIRFSAASSVIGDRGGTVVKVLCYKSTIGIFH